VRTLPTNAFPEYCPEIFSSREPIYFWQSHARPIAYASIKTLLNSKTMTPLSSARINHILTIWGTHPGAKPRGSFPFTVGAFQRALHKSVLSV
jgi:hypothetical protein